MATAEDLKDVLKETLEHRGVLGQIKARIRAEVFNALDDQNEEKPSLSNENMLMNELIREYLEFNKYKYTLSVLMTESGQPKEPLDHQFLAKELNITEDNGTTSVPLLYGMLAHFMKGNRSRNEFQPTARVNHSDDIYPKSDYNEDHHPRKPASISITSGKR
ncbi:lisH domain-containing protein FOPNL-like [Dendronephthya gigantea]|uniref:lisH domain-containing protein FOPNL-like n=1 Tax=Dendronephthya gigantea TaxID=151771 RepID=UPI00106994FB|nr:lisH domain-containing protein FOPNL-like [Dendronephthya gigantea]